MKAKYTYWRRSSRWRRAWKSVKRPRDRWRLYALAERMDPFDDKNWINKIAYIDSLLMMPALIKALAGPNPFLASGPLPDVSNEIRKTS